MKKLLFLSILSITIGFNTGCYKDIDNTQENITTTEQPDIIINTNLHGNFTEASGNISDNYTVVINEQSFEVNQDIYSIQLEGAKKKNQHVSIVQNGTEVAFANVSIIENDDNKLNIKSFPAKENVTLTSTDNILSLTDNNWIEFSTNESIDISYIEIVEKQLLDQMGKWGTDNEGNNYFLHTTSAFYINSENLSTTVNPVELIHTNTSDNASLFYLNESFHQWVLVDQFGSDKTRITLPQLGYYILANTSAAIFSEGQLTFEELPISYQDVALSILENNSLELISTAKGKWSTFLPVDFISTLSISDPCDGIVHEEEIQIGDSNINFETSLPDSDKFIPLNFASLNCEGEIVSNPAVIIDFGETERTMIFSDESPKLAVLSCGDIAIRAFDVLEDQEGINLAWSNDIEDELDYLSSCENYTDGFSFLKINGEMEILDRFTLDREGSKSIFRSSEDDIRLIIQGEAIGEYQNEEVNFFIDDREFGVDGYRMFCENSMAGCGFDDCYISHYEEMSTGLTRITFSGVLWMQTIENPTAGNYQVEGQIITSQ